MAGNFLSRGFLGKRRQPDSDGRLPPGQYVTHDFPVLSAGPTPRTPLDQWTFSIEGLIKEPKRWTWEEFLKLPSKSFTTDIHCVTKWSKFDTHWEGVTVDTLLASVELEPTAKYLMAFSDGGYTTNLPLEDVINGQGFIGYRYDGKPLAPEHGGPARLVVPHLYFWKSAKWIRGFRLMEKDQAGFWESLGYNNRGDPWKEERYWGD
jgi:DMSO/TMAO reductase YedYZ molybdopterin-dependent catalytic subunit